MASCTSRGAGGNYFVTTDCTEADIQEIVCPFEHKALGTGKRKNQTITCADGSEEIRFSPKVGSEAMTMEFKNCTLNDPVVALLNANIGQTMVLKKILEDGTIEYQKVSNGGVVDGIATGDAPALTNIWDFALLGEKSNTCADLFA